MQIFATTFQLSGKPSVQQKETLPCKKAVKNGHIYDAPTLAASFFGAMRR